MARYNYRCSKCKMQDYVESNIEECEIYVDPDAEDALSEDFIWEVSHPLTEDPIVKCVLCSEVTQKTFAGVRVTGYTKGSGYLDKAGVRREMSLHTLQTKDPYAAIRPEGDREVLEKKINKVGRASMNYKSRMDEWFVKGVDDTNSEYVQKLRRELISKKRIS